MNNRTLLIALLGVIVVIGGISAAVMISASTYMNEASDYVSTHAGDLPIPIPLPGAIAYSEPPVRVEAVARYGEAVEVQVTRRYKTARSPEASFTVTYFYAPDGGAWRRIPPPDLFWGEGKVTAGTRVVITHPQRDQRLIDSLIAALDTALNEACERWECRQDLTPVQVRFVTDPAGVGPLSFLAPRLTGVPMSREANADFLAYVSAEAVTSLSGQLGLSPGEARAEILRQGLYLP